MSVEDPDQSFVYEYLFSKNWFTDNFRCCCNGTTAEVSHGWYYWCIKPQLERPQGIHEQSRTAAPSSTAVSSGSPMLYPTVVLPLYPTVMLLLFHTRTTLYNYRAPAWASPTPTNLLEPTASRRTRRLPRSRQDPRMQLGISGVLCTRAPLTTTRNVTRMEHHESSRTRASTSHLL